MTLYEYLYNNFEYIISVDSEYRGSDFGDKTEVVCFCYRNLKTQERFDCVTPEDILNLPWPHHEAVYIVFNATAEADAWINWNIPIPPFIIDLYLENKNLIQDGISRETGFYGQLAAAHRYKIDEKYIMSGDEKNHWRELIINNETYTDKEWVGILDYCYSDTVLCGMLLEPTLRHIEIRLQKTDHEKRLNQILFRARAKAYEAKIYNWGIHVDAKKFDQFEKYWPQAKCKYINAVNEKLDVFESGVFKYEKFVQLLIRNNLSRNWPRTATGRYSSKKETLDNYKSNPDIKQLREALRINGSDKLLGFNRGKDGVSREWLKWFHAISGRATPSTSKYPFNSPRWTREFIKPPEGQVYAYVDYRAQEPNIMARLSNDKLYIEAVESPDIYTTTAILSGALPKDATKKSHPAIRGQFKTTVLATTYSASAYLLMQQLQCSFRQAELIQSSIKKTFSTYFRWNEERIYRYFKQKRLQTVFGWTRHLPKGEKVNQRSVANFPIQATAGEMTRLAYVELIDAGFVVAGTVHDAVLIMVPKDDYKAKLKEAQQIMVQASITVIGHPIYTDIDIITDTFKQARLPDGTGAGDTYDEIFKYIDEVKNDDELS